MSRSVVRKFGRHVVAHEVEHGDQIPGFCILEVGYGIYGVGFVTLFMKTHRSEGRLGLLMLLYLQRLSLLMVARQWQILVSSRNLAAPWVTVVDLCSRWLSDLLWRREEREKWESDGFFFFFFSNCWIFIFPHVTHLLKNERKLEIFKLEVSLSHFLFILWSIDFNIISYHIIYYIILNIKKKIAEIFLEF